MGLVDKVYGGYGSEAKFPDVEATEFLLHHYEATGDSLPLVHAALTLSNMRKGKIHDERNGGFFRYSSKPNWNEPHREKIARDQVGLLGNYLHAFLLTELPEYKQVAENIVAFVNARLTAPTSGAFYGCEDFLRVDAAQSKEGFPSWLTATDHCIYTDGNSKMITAYLDAWWVLGRPDCRERALKALDFLWTHCHTPQSGMYHYFDDEPHVPGLLRDNVFMGEALLDAFNATGEDRFVGQAKGLANRILLDYVNPSGGFYDLRDEGPAHLQFRLTPLADNSSAAAFLVRLANLTGEERFREGAQWALHPFTEAFRQYGVASAAYGVALTRYLARPLRIKLYGRVGDPRLATLARAALVRLGRFDLVFETGGVSTETGPSVREPRLYLEKEAKEWGPFHDANAFGPELVATLEQG